MQIKLHGKVPPKGQSVNKKFNIFSFVSTSSLTIPCTAMCASALGERRHLCQCWHVHSVDKVQLKAHKLLAPPVLTLEPGRICFLSPSCYHCVCAINRISKSFTYLLFEKRSILLDVWMHWERNGW